MENEKNTEFESAKVLERFNYQINTVAKKAIENARAIYKALLDLQIEVDEPLENLQLKKHFHDLEFYLHAIELKTRDVGNLEFTSDEHIKELERYGF